MSQNSLFRKFMMIWFGQLISNIGSGLTAFTLGVFAFQKTQSAICYSLIMLFSFLPALILKPIGGVLADRYDRRLLMIIGDLGAASGLLFILAFQIAGSLEVWHIYTGVAISSIFAAVQNPSYKASVTDFLTDEEYSKASGLMQLASSSQYLISPVLAGILFSFMNIEYILVIDIFTFVVAVFTVFGVKRTMMRKERKQESASVAKELSEGVKYLVANKGILVLAVIITLICFYMGFLQTLMGPMVLGFTSPKSFGIAQSLCAVGILVSSLIIGVKGSSKNHIKTMSLFLALAGLFYALMGVSSNIYLIVIPGFLFFYTLAFIQTSAEVLIRQNVDNEKQGRVWSLISVITQLGYPLAYCMAGFFADKVFNPLLVPGGLLTSSIGKIIGVGQGRGIGLMFIIFGIFVVMLSLLISKIKAIRVLEKDTLIHS